MELTPSKEVIVCDELQEFRGGVGVATYFVDRMVDLEEEKSDRSDYSAPIDCPKKRSGPG